MAFLFMLFVVILMIEVYEKKYGYIKMCKFCVFSFAGAAPRRPVYMHFVDFNFASKFLVFVEHYCLPVCIPVCSFKYYYVFCVSIIIVILLCNDCNHIVS